MAERRPVAPSSATPEISSPRRTPRRKQPKVPSTEFNPRLIFSQIVAIQCFHYLFLGIFIQINCFLFNSDATIDRIFTDTYLNVWTLKGAFENCGFVLGFFFNALLLAIIVEKSKKCLDFSVTLFFIHLVSCTLYGGIPKSFDWWILHVMGTVIMVLFGEYLCSLKELSDIPLLEI
mmetsp:Transcript_21243/g.31555  ORF Transcript_21243/g.31555 Transcript_21243/m.31555 type:complete len:176 (-) Transcript_21243:1015-1542(-)